MFSDFFYVNYFFFHWSQLFLFSPNSITKNTNLRSPRNFRRLENTFCAAGERIMNLFCHFVIFIFVVNIVSVCISQSFDCFTDVLPESKDNNLGKQRELIVFVLSGVYFQIIISVVCCIQPVMEPLMVFLCFSKHSAVWQQKNTSIFPTISFSATGEKTENTNCIHIVSGYSVFVKFWSIRRSFRSFLGSLTKTTIYTFSSGESDDWQLPVYL